LPFHFSSFDDINDRIYTEIGEETARRVPNRIVAGNWWLFIRKIGIFRREGNKGEGKAVQHGRGTVLSPLFFGVMPRRW
jgi:hypothetical protein